MAKQSGSSSSGGAVITAAAQDASAKSLFHALSEIEQLSIAELRSNLPEGSLPMQPRFTFIDVACKSAAMMTFMTFLTAPFSIAVTEKIMPAFGNTNPSIIDKLYVYLFSCAPALAFSILITAIISRTYTGTVTKGIVSRFTSSYISTKIVLSLLLLLICYALAQNFFTTENVWGALGYFDVFFKSAPQKKETIYYFLMEFQQVIVPASIYATLVHIGTAGIITAGYLKGVIKTRKIERLRREWE